MPACDREGRSGCESARRPVTGAGSRSTAACKHAADMARGRGPLALLLLLAFAAPGCGGAGAAGQEADDERPNVVVLMTDDQTVESLRVMRAVRPQPRCARQPPSHRRLRPPPEEGDVAGVASAGGLPDHARGQVPQSLR